MNRRNSRDSEYLEVMLCDIADASSISRHNYLAAAFSTAESWRVWKPSYELCFAFDAMLNDAVILIDVARIKSLSRVQGH